MDLRAPRTGHAMAVRDNYLYMVGGHGKIAIERWTFANDEVVLVENSKTLLNEYIHYPTVYAVPDTYFDNC